MIIEEAAHVSEEVFKQMVVPLYGMKDTAVIAISTPEDEDNWYSQLAETGLFKTVQLGLACQDCIDRRMADKCTHKESRLPDWKPEERQEMTEKLLASDQARMHRELHGVVSSKKQFVFKKFTSQMKGLAPYRFKQRPDVLYLSIDPSGGGGSDYAYMLMAHEDGYDVIIGYQSIDTSDENDIKSLFMGLFKRLRQNRLYQDALVHVFIETNNCYFTSLSMKRFFLSEPGTFGNVQFEEFRNKKDGQGNETVGVRSGHNEKVKYVDYVRHQMAAGRIVFAEQQLGYEKRLEEQKKMIFEQLNTYRKEIKESSDPGFIDEKVVYTGKLGGRKDDLCMALQIGAYYSQEKRNDEEFVKQCRAKGKKV